MSKKKPQGIAGFFGDLMNNTAKGAVNVLRPALNAEGSAIAWLRSDSPKNYQYGDSDFGPAPAPASPQKAQQQTKATAAKSQLLPSPISSQGDPVPQSLSDQLAPYMQMATKMGLGSTDTTNYDSLIGQLNSQGAAGQAKLQAMYNQLGGSVANDAAGIKQNFTDAGSALAANTAQASKADANAYASTQAANNAQMQALGIPQAAGVLQANGAQATRDQNLAQSQLQLANAGNQAANTAHSANAVNYNTGVKESVGMAGAQAQATLQQQLAAKLAEIESAKTNAQSSNSSNTFNAAVKLMGMDPNSSSNQAAAQQSATQTDLANQLKASQIALNYSKAQGSTKTVQAALTGNLQANATLQKYFTANGGNASDSSAYAAFLKNVASASKLTK